ncbi:MAG TPA: DegT/DnrJ/EryC1/StrS family aminotransferase [Syntrophales bacterium]|jgi:dTDP-4-amino-4,6-dideoxygalactose transaminase|nr:DegT/DnrJ/EryC1/StrS family aminotransferase [Syntrophales bacterium]
MRELALFGGPKTISHPFSPYRSIGSEEEEAVRSVVESGILSRFLGTWSPDFYGGERVQALERAWEKHFSVRHAVTVNSATSGLIAAVGAVGVEPGDEVIVSPWTMSASATAILIWNAIPVFADIEEETYNLDPVSIEKNITPRTRAIMVPDIFGHPADLDAIMKIADRHGLKVIEDAAQAPGALYKGRFAGTVAHVGVFSLNYHKHIHTGEGGVCVTDNPVLAERLQLIRNHAEAVAGDKGVEDFSNLIGFNFRMTEIEAAIGIEQLKKLPALSTRRIAVAERFTEGLKDLKGLRTPVVKADCTHVYYVYPLVYRREDTGVCRSRVFEALRAEGVPVGDRYVNLHLLPLYQKKIAYGTKGFPWTAGFYDGNVSYDKGICPVAEGLQDERHLGIGLCVNEYGNEDVDLIIEAFHKVWHHLDRLERD